MKTHHSIILRVKRVISGQLHSLGARTLAFFLIALSAITVLVYVMLSHELEHHHTTHAESLLQERLQALQGENPKPETHPVYYHWGSLESAQRTEHWPKDCAPPPASDKQPSAQPVQIECGKQLITFIQTNIHLQTSGEKTISLWTAESDDKILWNLKIQDILGMTVLILLIAIHSSQWISRSFVKPLQGVAQGALKMANGDYDHRIPHSNIDEINWLVSSFNHMAKTLQEREKQIRRTAYKDQLTGLNNRAFLTLALRERIENAREPLTILTWGIDNLDSINEVLGYEVAEKVLIREARKSRRLCKDNVVIARLDGHIYCAVLPASLYKTYKNKKWMQRLMQGSVRVGSYLLDIQSHAGVALYPEHGEHAEHLLRRSEIARQLACKTGQNLIEFEPRMEKRSSLRLELVTELKNAIINKEFCLYYQPKLNLRTNTITQAEVLLRWNHPSKGVIGPGGFIELAEQTGMIRDITRWVMNEVYTQAALCQQQNIRLSMNLSALDLEDNELLEFARTLHTKSPDLAKSITLEITESAAMRDPDHALDLLRNLSDMGFLIAIDDFGAGYSSLAYLKRFPVSELKIDRSLVQGADFDNDAQIILESTIQMGHIMGLLVTTEGVENDGEFDVVRRLGTDYVQGFWLAKPMPYEEFKLKHLVGNQETTTHPS